MVGPAALALVELNSIARGYRVLDALVKKSPVEILEANLVEPGVFLILFAGAVAEVEEAHTEALAVAADTLMEEVFITGVHEGLLDGLTATLDAADPDTIGVVEGMRVAPTLEACDRALKDARVSLLGFRLAGGLGGKAFYVLHGLQHDVEAAAERSREILQDRGALAKVEIIARPHPDFLPFLLRKAPFSLET